MSHGDLSAEDGTKWFCSKGMVDVILKTNPEAGEGEGPGPSGAPAETFLQTTCLEVLCSAFLGEIATSRLDIDQNISEF